MNKYIIVILFMLGCGCAAADTERELGPLDVWAFPVDAQVHELSRSDVEQAWMSHGLPALDNCPQEYAVHLPAERGNAFKKFCGVQACTPDAAPGTFCARACSRTLNDGRSPIMLTIGDDVNRCHEEAHELLHMWAECTTGDSDHDHTRSELWDDVLGAF